MIRWTENESSWKLTQQSKNGAPQTWGSYYVPLSNRRNSQLQLSWNCWLIFCMWPWGFWYWLKLLLYVNQLSDNTQHHPGPIFLESKFYPHVHCWNYAVLVSLVVWLHILYMVLMETDPKLIESSNIIHVTDSRLWIRNKSIHYASWFCCSYCTAQFLYPMVYH